MAYYLDLFSPATYEAFSRSDRTISGFRPRQRTAAQRIKPGDRLLCYMTRLSRWIGVLEVESGPFDDATPRFYPEDDPFTVRFRVKPIHWLPLEKCVPIHEDQVWKYLSFTRDQSKNTSNWTGKLRGSLGQISTEDGQFLERLLASQTTSHREWPVKEEEYRRLLVSRVRGVTKDITVTVPIELEAELETLPAEPDVRESTRLQALLAERRSARAWACTSGFRGTTERRSLPSGRAIMPSCSPAFRSTTMTLLSARSLSTSSKDNLLRGQQLANSIAGVALRAASELPTPREIVRISQAQGRVAQLLTSELGESLRKSEGGT